MASAPLFAANSRANGNCGLRLFGRIDAADVAKGSIAVDGVSLTLVEVLAEQFSIMLIPHTLIPTQRWVAKGQEHTSTWKPTCWPSMYGRLCRYSRAPITP